MTWEVSSGTLWRHLEEQGILEKMETESYLLDQVGPGNHGTPSSSLRRSRSRPPGNFEEDFHLHIIRRFPPPVCKCSCQQSPWKSSASAQQEADKAEGRYGRLPDTSERVSTSRPSILISSAAGGRHIHGSHYRILKIWT